LLKTKGELALLTTFSVLARLDAEPPLATVLGEVDVEEKRKVTVLSRQRFGS